MKKSNLKHLLALSAALGITCAGSAQAQWTITGPSPLGGNAFTGSGNVGPLSTSTSPALSLNGGDTITLNIGGIASNTTSGVDTIIISGPNNILTNNGAIVSDNFGDYAIDLYASNQQIINNGAIVGGNGAAGGNDGGQAIYGYASALDMISITNHGSILGGNGSDGTGSGGGAGSNAIYLYATSTDLTNTSIVNTSMIQGGAGGSDASAVGGAGGTAIYLEANGNILNTTINNSGSILGGAGGASAGTGGNTDTSYGGSAIYAYANSVLANFSLTNSGMIIGGKGGDDTATGYSPHGGYGVYAEGYYGINNLSINNSGSILGGAGGNSTGPAGSGYGGYGYGGSALYLYSDFNGLNGLNLYNTGLIQGGAGGSAGSFGDYPGYGGDGMHVNAYGGLTNTVITNKGTIAGGAGGSANLVGNYGSYGGGYGMYIVQYTSGGITNFTLNNSGLITGGNGMDSPSYYNTYGGLGMALYAYTTDITNVLINNSGTIAGGNAGNSTYVGTSSNYGGGYALTIFEVSNDINGLTLNNSGLIKGGNGGNNYGEYGNPGNYGVLIYGNHNVNGLTINNTGSILGGNGGDSLGASGYGYGDNTGGYALYVETNALNNLVLNNSGRIAGGNGGLSNYESGYGGYGLAFSLSAINNSILNNSPTGVIQGGNGGTIDGSINPGSVGGYGGAGIYIYAPVATNTVFNNWGVIQGGNGGIGINGGWEGYAGQGIIAYTNGLVVNNWGAINSGVGASATAVAFNGSNNELNLNGHSSVFGVISAIGNANNVVNLNFTGVSPLEQKQMISQIEAQGSLANWSGVFTLRGVTYTIDPVVLNINLSSYQLQAQTPAEAAIGASLDSLTFNPAPGTPLANLLNAIDASGNVPLALNALSPQSYQIFGDIAESTANMLTLTIDERLNNLRDGSESIDTTGIGGGTDKTTAGYSKDGKDNKNVTVPEKAVVDRRWGFFAQGGGLFSTIDAHQGLAGSNFTTSSVVVGVDGKVNDNFVVGALFNYDYTTADTDNLGSHANVQTLGGGLYAGYHNSGWYANALAAYGHNQYDSQRVIAFPGFNSTAQGGADGNQYEGNLDGGYDFNVSDRLSVGPLIGLQYVHLDVNNLNEWGSSGAGLNVGSQSVDSLRSRIGFHAQYKVQLRDEVAFATEVHAAWQHEFMDDSRAISASFLGGSLPFSVQTTSPERDAAVVGIGANLTIRNRMTLFINYDVQAGQQSYFEQTVKGGVKLAF